MRKLALVYDVAYPFVEGGGQKRMHDIARYFVKWGWKVDWYCLKTWEGAAVQLREGITFHGLKGFTQFYAGDGTRSARAALSFGRAVLFADVSFSGYDIVWCGQWPFFHIFALAARLVPWRTRLVVDWWEVWGPHWLVYGGVFGFFGRIMEWMLVNFVTRVGHAVGISRLGIDQALALGARTDGLTYIPNGVDMAAFQAATPEQGQVDIASFGRIKDHKNIDHIIRAVALARERGKRWLADIIGDGPELLKIKALASELKVNEQINFHGRVDEGRLMGLLKRARVFVHPSTKEAGGSITMLEANACGLPIVCYRHPLGIDPTLIRDRTTGLLIDDICPEGLDLGIEEMLAIATNGDVRQACIDHASEFDWGVIAGKYRALFGWLLNDPDARAGDPS
jgi:glycosyltransferase involved in cell wall biosynthesis